MAHVPLCGISPHLFVVEQAGALLTLTCVHVLQIAERLRSWPQQQVGPVARVLYVSADITAFAIQGLSELVVQSLTHLIGVGPLTQAAQAHHPL